MTDKELMQAALKALERNDYLGWRVNIPIINALRERLASWDALERMADNARELGLDYDEPRRS